MYPQDREVQDFGQIAYFATWFCHFLHDIEERSTEFAGFSVLRGAAKDDLGAVTSSSRQENGQSRVFLAREDDVSGATLSSPLLGDREC